MIGAPSSWDARGSIYIFERSDVGPNEWAEVGEIIPSASIESDYFGYTVSISGDTLVVVSGWYGGDVRIFQRRGDANDDWFQVAKLWGRGMTDYHRIGRSAAISGDTVVVGADGYDANGPGAAYVFQRDAGGDDAWGSVAKLTLPGGPVLERFGESVAIEGDTIAVSAPVALDAGSVYIFERDAAGAGNWGHTVKLRSTGEGFGRTVAISGDTIVVGGPRLDGNGVVSVFERDKQREPRGIELPS